MKPTWLHIVERYFGSFMSYNCRFPSLFESCCLDTSVINPPSSAHIVPVYLSTTECVFSSTDSAVLGAESCDYTCSVTTLSLCSSVSVVFTKTKKSLSDLSNKHVQQAGETLWIWQLYACSEEYGSRHRLAQRHHLNQWNQSRRCESVCEIYVSSFFFFSDTNPRSWYHPTHETLWKKFIIYFTNWHTKFTSSHEKQVALCY